MTRSGKSGAGDGDLARVREVMDSAMKAVKRQSRFTPEQARRILDERARELARIPDEDLAGDGLDVVVFELGREGYALEARYVIEIAELPEVSRVPETPEHFLGVVNLRGQILTVVDLASLLQIQGRKPTERCHLVVLGKDQPELGVVADAVRDVSRLWSSQLLSVSEATAGPVRELVKGTTRDALILIDGAALLRDDRLFMR